MQLNLFLLKVQKMVRRCWVKGGWDKQTSGVSDFSYILQWPLRFIPIKLWRSTDLIFQDPWNSAEWNHSESGVTLLLFSVRYFVTRRSRKRQPQDLTFKVKPYTTAVCDFWHNFWSAKAKRASRDVTALKNKASALCATVCFCLQNMNNNVF